MLGGDAVVLEVPRVVPAARFRSLVWRLATRFAFAYLTLYIATTQLVSTLITWPGGSAPDLSTLGAVRDVVRWTAAHVFGVATPLVIDGSGSGDKTYDWVQAFCLLVLAAIVTPIWSIAAPRIARAASFEKWLRLAVRLTLGATLISYGMAKVVPLQMPYPPLTRLLEPFGHFSPMGVLWYSIGASRPYEIFTGCVELTAGVLLLIPHTALLGALLGLVCMTQVFMLNMTYDVPVKLFSFHLILMALFLLAPDARRLVNVVLLNRPADRSPGLVYGGSARVQRLAVILQVVFAMYIVGVNLKGATDAWSTYGGGAPKSPLYGVWNVAYMSIDGVERAPLVTDYDRWRRVVFDTPARMAFQRMDDTFAQFGSRVDVDARSLTLTKPADEKWTAAFSFDRPTMDRLVLDGEMDGKNVQLRLELFPRERFLLVDRGFHWVQEYPFNR